MHLLRALDDSLCQINRAAHTVVTLADDHPGVPALQVFAYGGAAFLRKSLVQFPGIPEYRFTLVFFMPHQYFDGNQRTAGCFPAAHADAETCADLLEKYFCKSAVRTDGTGASAESLEWTEAQPSVLL